MAAGSDSGDAAKLQRHLDLLRQEYVKLQQRLAESEQKYAELAAASGQLRQDHFVSRLMRTVEELFDRKLYSDIKIKMDGQMLYGHRFVLVARSDHWCEGSLNDLEELELPGLTYDVAHAMVRWVYTDKLEMRPEYDQDFVVKLLAAADKYQLMGLKMRCEKTLMSTVTVQNCIKLFQTATDAKANELRKYCLEMISSHWDELDTAMFADLSAPLLYEMFKDKSRYPLHLAIKHKREDVEFLFLIEYNSELKVKLNERNEDGELPIHLALITQNESIASQLVSHGCNVDLPDSDGRCLLHDAITRGDNFAARFLIKNGAGVEKAIVSTKETPLHLAASYKLSAVQEQDESSADEMKEVIKLMLENGANSNAQDLHGCTPLHRAVLSHNTPVFDLLLQQSNLNLELRDSHNRNVLWLALLTEGQCEKSGRISSLNESRFSVQLVNHGSSPDAVDDLTGNSLLHISAEEGLEVAGMFLASHGAQPNRANRGGETPLHKAAAKGLAQLTALLLMKGGNPNAQTHKDPSISLDIEEHMEEVSTLTREVKAMSPDVTTTDVRPSYVQTDAPSVQFDLPRPPSLSVGSNNPFDLGTMAQQVANLNPFNSPVIRQASNNPFDSSPEAAPVPSPVPSQHEQQNPKPKQTEPPPARQTQQEPQVDPRMAMVDRLSTVVKEIPRLHTSCKTPLHLAVQNRHQKVVKVFLEHKANAESSGYIALDVNVMDGEEQTALGLALWRSQLDIADMLVEAGADVESQTRQGLTLLLQAILRGDDNSASFLLQRNADYSASAFDMSPLFLAIHLRLPHVVEAVCRHGANTNKVDQNGDPPLWVALSSKQEDLASILIRNRCDSNVWHMAPGGYLRTLLHRAIEMKDSAAANFLIRNGADIGRSRQGNPVHDTASGSPPPNTPPEAKDRSAPLHMATALGLDLVVQTLMEHQADVNARDSEGRSPIHVAIVNKHHMCIHLLMSHPSVDLNLKDRNGRTPFAAAMAVRDNDAANTILSREPNAAHQIDAKGYSFMHTAIQHNDVESVVFLMSVGVSVNTRLQNATELTPLHMAVEGGSEIICRHLLLAGADVHATNHHKQTPLHIGASGGQSAILSILLENGTDPDALDDNLNNGYNQLPDNLTSVYYLLSRVLNDFFLAALHVGVYFGHLVVVKTLLLESNIAVDAVNMRGQTPLHMLGEHAKDNAAVIFETMLECVPTLNVNAQDALGHTPLLLAYINGASNLCRALIKAGAHAGIQNRQGVTIFNAQVATKMLLWRLLDMLPKEPEWLDGSACQNCGTGFGIKTRKHHCRHCGRLLDSKCCSKQMPLIKFGLMKPVRVCNECWEVLTSANSTMGCQIGLN